MNREFVSRYYRFYHFRFRRPVVVATRKINMQIKYLYLCGIYNATALNVLKMCDGKPVSISTGSESLCDRI